MNRKVVVFLVLWSFLSAIPMGRAAASDQARCFTDISESSGVEEYSFNSALGTYTEITGGTVSSATGDDGFQDINLPFVFIFDSLTFDSARISVNGWLQLGQTYVGSGSANDLANADVRPILAPFWDDLYDDATSEIRYQVNGASPERVSASPMCASGWRRSTAPRRASPSRPTRRPARSSRSRFPTRSRPTRLPPTGQNRSLPEPGCR